MGSGDDEWHYIKHVQNARTGQICLDRNPARTFTVSTTLSPTTCLILAEMSVGSFTVALSLRGTGDRYGSLAL